ncbi:protein tyrosine phosphatase family protein [Microbulbifer sp. CAU 1566]|uniref:beta-lactamase hydrolase domain-containing protein n=1 Tax=Microbulbifer sp. CAU 1566 TaxID=2933269 RepID=UPI002004B0EA|nr:protein tyrosine phosphatase family protein [Microbulbifer sp. CAU 1566]MCK7596915.1 protein tyrosine phosphatase family protein [Microbulbifer sp. CAU 1566]
MILLKTLFTRRFLAFQRGKVTSLGVALFALFWAATGYSSTEAPSQVPFGDKMGAEVLNYNRLRPQLATGGSIDLAQVESLKNKGFKTIVDLRTPEEGTVEEQTAVEAAGMVYVNLPVSKGAPSDQLIAQLGKILENADAAPVLLHCASGNRVGAVWAIYRARQGIPLEIAIEEGRTAGMRASREEQVRALLQ